MNENDGKKMYIISKKEKILYKKYKFSLFSANYENKENSNQKIKFPINISKENRKIFKKF